MKPVFKLLLVTGIFAIAMGFMESAVVIYLRALYYPEGFAFPLKMLTGTIAVTEILREAATMIMLITVAWMSVKGALERFAIFIYAFAIWDIFYYLFLYLLIGWPETFFTWDLLFLIPLPWTGPVLAPVINSLTMILLAALILRYRKYHEHFRLDFYEWMLLILGSVITIFSYTESYLKFLHSAYSFSDIFHKGFTARSSLYTMIFIPDHYNWPMFIFGELVFFAAMLNMIWKMRKV